jgi:hypothetical protein
VNKKTLVLGVSLNPERYSYMAVRKLKFNNIPVVAVGMREGEINGVIVEKPFPKFEGIHTVTLYIGPKNLPVFYDYILDINPKRVIFNPGTENPEFEEILTANGIEVIRGCTLIMISSGQY